MPQTFKEFCAEVYGNTYTAEQERLIAEAVAASRNGTISSSKAAEIETAAQKEAIKQATIAAFAIMQIQKLP